MVKIFWMFVASQVLLVLSYAFTWPESSTAWTVGLLCYLLFSFALIAMAAKLGKENRTYYYVGLFGSYINWAVFGTLGMAVSVVVSALGAFFL